MLTLHNKVDDATYDLEDQYDEAFTKQMRMGFIRRVYGLLSIQFILTCLITTIMFTKGVREYIIYNYTTTIWVTFISSLLSLVIILICRFSNTNYMQQYPINLVILFTITFLESLPVGCLCVIIPGRSILIALIATTVAVIGMTIYALQTKYDYTSYTSLLLYGSIGLVVASIISLFIPYSKLFEIFVGSFGAMFYAFVLLMITQSIIGKHENIIYEDDYVGAALLLHLTILDMFIYILKIVVNITDIQR
ncbi:hypothetical protein cand_028390 [Cryptosporidium andersoni]|uniref:Uncharacterized protein n=1 Tax=Cryptosporidium andersoni TaxID=117008 RepID=A0A1J4MQX8_9CRYT|nr:hypothetical protein cand_028390 [Cryptosporidium andersoni]